MTARRPDSEGHGMERPKHILVVELDPGVRSVVCESLATFGYRVDVAEDAPAMLRILEGSDPIDLIVLDASLCHLEPITLATRAREHGIRLVMMSGSPRRMEEFAGRHDQLMCKPFKPGRLR